MLHCGFEGSVPPGFKDAVLPRVVPLGRLDMASEGLLLFTNDTRWADRLLDPGSRVARVYHVQVEPRPAPGLCGPGDRRLAADPLSI
jgi:16S rRNA U516 pseudouridylate synthase RsuA-like enzyme